METWNTRTKILIIVSLLITCTLFTSVYAVFFNGPNKEGGENIAVYLEGDVTKVDIFSSEQKDYIFKGLSNRLDDEHILSLATNRVGKAGEILRLESENWDRSVTITFHDTDQQLIRNVIDKSTGSNVKLYTYVSWQNKLSTGSGWSIMIHADAG